MSNQILKVGQSKEKAQLTKSQKEFNRLTARIEKIRAEIRQTEEVTDRLQQRNLSVLVPLQQKYAQGRAELVYLFDKAHRSGVYKNRERKKLEELIINMVFELITNDDMVALKEIYDRYHEISYDEEVARMQDEASDEVKEMLQNMFGLNLDDEEVDLSDPEKMQAYFEKQMAEEEKSEQERWQQQEARQANRPKTAKQLEKEQKQAEEERKISKSVREVYVELAKAFHPDLEPDEQEKQRKTEVMQRIAQAYENNDLLTLLQLQLEFEQIDQEHLENIAEDRLKHFTKILQRQAAELQNALYEAMENLEAVVGFPFQGSALYMEQLLEREIKEMKKHLRELEKEIQHLSDPVYLKLWLKEYEIGE